MTSIGILLQVVELEIGQIAEILFQVKKPTTSSVLLFVVVVRHSFRQLRLADAGITCEYQDLRLVPPLKKPYQCLMQIDRNVKAV